MSTTEDEIRELDRRWAEAERRGDVAALDALSAEDFTPTSPSGTAAVGSWPDGT